MFFFFLLLALLSFHSQIAFNFLDIFWMMDSIIHNGERVFLERLFDPFSFLFFHFFFFVLKVLCFFFLMVTNNGLCLSNGNHPSIIVRLLHYKTRIEKDGL